jgi:multiple sugar transport system permease protein
MRPSSRWAQNSTQSTNLDAANLTGLSDVAETGAQKGWIAAFGGPGFDRAREWVTQALFLAPAIVYLLLFFGYPAVTNFVMSLEHYTTRSFLTGEAPFVGFANYQAIAQSPLFAKTIYNTAVFTVGSIIGQFGLGLVLALFFHKNFPLSRLVRSLLLLPWLLPAIASSAVWRWILDRDSGVLNELLTGSHLTQHVVPWLTNPSVALITVTAVNIWIGIPFNLTILYGGRKAIPADLYEAAALDGATGWQAFRYVTWPMLRPVVMVVLVLGVVYTIKTLDIILGLTHGGPANATQTLATRAYQVSFVEFDFGKGAAWSNLLVLTSLVFSLIYLRLNRTKLAL